MAIHFNIQNNKYTATGGVPTGTSAKTYTVCGWFKITTDRNNYSPIIEFTAAADDANWIMTTVDGTTLCWVSTTGSEIGNVSATTNTWYRFAATFSSGSVTMRVAAAGADFPSAATGTLSASSMAYDGMWIGAEEFGQTFQGDIANLKIYNAVLSLDEMNIETLRYLPNRVANLLHWHPFLDLDTADYSGNANNLTAGSSAPTRADGPPIPWA